MPDVLDYTIVHPALQAFFIYIFSVIAYCIHVHLTHSTDCSFLKFCQDIDRCFIITSFLYPKATSSTIISTKPTANAMVPTLLCSPSFASGINSSTTT